MVAASAAEVTGLAPPCHVPPNPVAPIGPLMLLEPTELLTAEIAVSIAFAADAGMEGVGSPGMPGTAGIAGTAGANALTSNAVTCDAISSKLGKLAPRAAKSGNSISSKLLGIISIGISGISKSNAGINLVISSNPNVRFSLLLQTALSYASPSGRIGGFGFPGSPSRTGGVCLMFASGLVSTNPLLFVVAGSSWPLRLINFSVCVN